MADSYAEVLQLQKADIARVIDDCQAYEVDQQRIYEKQKKENTEALEKEVRGLTSASNSKTSAQEQHKNDLVLGRHLQRDDTIREIQAFYKRELDELSLASESRSNLFASTAVPDGEGGGVDSAVSSHTDVQVRSSAFATAGPRGYAGAPNVPVECNQVVPSIFKRARGQVDEELKQHEESEAKKRRITQSSNKQFQLERGSSAQTADSAIVPRSQPFTPLMSHERQEQPENEANATTSSPLRRPIAQKTRRVWRASLSNASAVASVNDLNALASVSALSLAPPLGGRPNDNNDMSSIETGATADMPTLMTNATPEQRYTSVFKLTHLKRGVDAWGPKEGLNLRQNARTYVFEPYKSDISLLTVQPDLAINATDVAEIACGFGKKIEGDHLVITKKQYKRGVATAANIVLKLTFEKDNEVDKDFGEEIGKAVNKFVALLIQHNPFIEMNDQDGFRLDKHLQWKYRHTSNSAGRGDRAFWVFVRRMQGSHEAKNGSGAFDHASMVADLQFQWAGLGAKKHAYYERIGEGNFR